MTYASIKDALVGMWLDLDTARTLARAMALFGPQVWVVQISGEGELVSASIYWSYNADPHDNGTDVSLEVRTYAELDDGISRARDATYYVHTYSDGMASARRMATEEIS